jgi:O-antigen/teichoic acid export membrane protein
MSGREPPERPPPPWHPFPLTELLVFIAVLCAGAALVTWGTVRSLWLAGAALSLALLAGLETSARQHFTGHRNQSTTLASALAATVATAAALAGLSLEAVLIAAFAAFAIAALTLRRSFPRRSRNGGR